jgi:hypothetical protein
LGTRGGCSDDLEVGLFPEEMRQVDEGLLVVVDEEQAGGTASPAASRASPAGAVALGSGCSGMRRSNGDRLAASTEAATIMRVLS